MGKQLAEGHTARTGSTWVPALVAKCPTQTSQLFLVRKGLLRLGQRGSESMEISP